MASPTVTSKGQATIPLDVRRQLGLGAGERIEFILNDEMVPANLPVTALKGIIRRPAKPVSIEDINSAIGEQGALAR
ncbi:hypothetical protein SBC1_50610 (plasmid) [Caballeronia sp. SBC1]|uniref:AbrB/MazE/SpoVT family DNA-binding domain-containing protein n=1 Tax=unclassified Caballeronia TaxID=2646786 RepID=UPI0013E20354|nr:MULTISPECIES: AbrB/MazE/SpoVT family DNA-binding domain-containing protein [unclassified Caballeronia]QIE25666.1 hypothetical protein SBC2_37360 [Caballeronia sp. SBC2]QIN65021.1 hypothetical protein SBC1_50610 [Caballeronia sp. SBC1]